MTDLARVAGPFLRHGGGLLVSDAHGASDVQQWQAH